MPVEYAATLYACLFNAGFASARGLSQCSPTLFTAQRTPRTRLECTILTDLPERIMPSKLFTPLVIANGQITLSHRVVMAPMTRNRGVPVEGVERVWIPDDVVALYYSQRASPGGLVITEGIPPSLEASGMPQVPGIFHPEQAKCWKTVVDAVHAKGGYIYAQLWHAGRATIPQMTGCDVVSASATPWETDEKFPFRTSAGEKIAYKDFPPVAMTKEHIAQTTADFVKAARTAIDVGFDGVEINGGNGNRE